MNNPVTFKGLTFKVGKYRIGLWWTLVDVSDGITGRVYFMPWTKAFWR